MFMFLLFLHVDLLLFRLLALLKRQVKYNFMWDSEWLMDTTKDIKTQMLRELKIKKMARDHLTPDEKKWRKTLKRFMVSTGWYYSFVDRVGASTVNVTTVLTIGFKDCIALLRPWLEAERVWARDNGILMVDEEGIGSLTRPAY